MCDTQLQVLIESEQIRKEADDSGPLTELEHWKCMSAKFNYIIEQIKGSSCKAVINVLNVAHSKLLKVKGLLLLTWMYFRMPYQKITLIKRLLKVLGHIVCVYHIDMSHGGQNVGSPVAGVTGSCEPHGTGAGDQTQSSKRNELLSHLSAFHLTH